MEGLWRRRLAATSGVRRNGAARRETAIGRRRLLLQNAPMRFLHWAIAPLLAACIPAFAQTAAAESEALAARFPDPAAVYRTPAFEPGHEGFTSNAELRALLQALVV
jgi:hypothetical protein